MNINIYKSIEKAIKTDMAFIYLKKNNAPFELIPFNNLFGAIEDIGDTSLSKSGIPNELTAQVDMSLEAPQITYVENESVVYYSPFESDTMEQVITIIKLFNRLSSMDLAIYTSHKIHKYVSEFANSNISFYCYDNPKELSIKANKIITHGFSARSFIQQKTPTIIIGPYGLGGWVTPANIDYLLKDNFKGRPGGGYNELIPLEILVDEFMEIKEEKNLSKNLNENALIVTNYIKQFPIENKESFVIKQNELYWNFIDINKRYSLIPKLASNVHLVKEKQNITVQRNEINDVLFTLPKSDLEFLDDLKNDLVCKELQEKYKMTDEEFWDIMNSLWERKAIIFNYDIS